jgi:hypothetical protein
MNGEETIQENLRLQETHEEKMPWRKWGPYVSERQWGTVREDYSLDGNAWEYFNHDQARSRAYHWGEDGIAGISDEKQRLCFALALWNGKDPIIKERLFGLTNSEGNHGEDVKEYYFYLDNTPTHSYMKYLYKYPQSPFPYDDLVKTNRQRSRTQPEYELIDTGIFNDDRYFDVFVEYAKASPEDILIKISVVNRGPETAELHVLPTLWFRNTWTWWPGSNRPALRKIVTTENWKIVAAYHAELGDRYFYCDEKASLLFTENETNNERISHTPNVTPYVKDAFNNYLIGQQSLAINPAETGTKAAAYQLLSIGPGETQIIKFRLSDITPEKLCDPFGPAFDETFDQRLAEADEFYQSITPPSTSEDEARIIRQGYAGMLWTKQYYYFEADKWLEEHGAALFTPIKRRARNQEWFHMINDHIISMPDKWEYPWYAAWDLAFHSIALAGIDPDFAKQQLDLMVSESYLHPSGQIPAYEWNFSDVNPPVHAWASLYIYNTERGFHGQGDIQFLKRMFSKLMVNFTWWTNRKDRFGKNVFEGGFLGLDNIGVFDRSAPLPTGGYLEQADGTAWMSLFCQNMFSIALEIAVQDPMYDDLALKFAEHFFWIAAAMNRPGNDGMWDEDDGFYYDLLRLPDGNASRLKVRSMVGLLPICAATIIEPWQRQHSPELFEKILQRFSRMPDLLKYIHATGPGYFGAENRGIAALVNEKRLRRILTRMLDENEFLSPYGIRSLSRYHLDHPYIVKVHNQEYRVDYLPAESNSAMFGGNSNWRGPIWMPVNILIFRALLQYYLYYGDNFKIECPTGSGRLMNLFEVSMEIASRLARLFLRNDQDRRPVFGQCEKFKTDPHWRDNINPVRHGSCWDVDVDDCRENRYRSIHRK